MEIKILYEDKDIVVIDKPSGLSVHPSSSQLYTDTEESKQNSKQTISEWFAEKYPESSSVGEPLGEISRPGVVHRLDMETSGVLILCKNQTSHAFIKSQFQNQQVEKTYLALVYGDLKKDSGVIDEPIGRSPTDFRRRLAGRGARGEMRQAVTEFSVLNRAVIDNQKYSLLEVHPKTGRTHQIRVHLKYLSYPVVCDRLYAPKNVCPQIFGRLMLHAKSIAFTKPDGKPITVESSLPEVFKKVLQYK